MNKLTCIAKLEAKEGHEDQVRLELTKLLAPTRKEKGCINYDMHVDNEAPNVFMFHETWESEADLDNHLNSDHIKACFGSIEGLLASVDVRRLTMIES